MRLPCPRCWGAREILIEGERVPQHELSAQQVAEALVLGGAHYREVTVACPRCNGTGLWRRNRMGQNKTFEVLAAEVQEALGNYRDAVSAIQGNRTEHEVLLHELERDKGELDAARAAFFEEYPELMPEPISVGQLPADPTSFTPIEVDDPDVVPDFRESPVQ